MLLFLFICLVCLFWSAYCLEKAHIQRMKIIDSLYKEDDWRSLREEFLSVSYDSHIWHLFCFKDPKKGLYPTLGKFI